MSARTLVVVSGLAASGKSTVARALARGLDLPLLDKDDVLEALFDSLGCADLATRGDSAARPTTSCSPSPLPHLRPWPSTGGTTTPRPRG